ncbi:MAG: DoxX family membrane protein [Candidatus Pelagibacter sp.]|tara:strand:- start:748 stop:1158 length:411 start_codon:yes stop_codon:yes gene_type:complete
MKKIIFLVNDFLKNFEALASLFLRLGISIAFIIHGWNKFPLPPQGLIEYFDLSPFLASFVALSEVSVGIILIIGGFIKNPYGNIITRFAGLTIIIIMVNIFVIAHQDWFITKKLFTSEQIFLLIGGIYFLLKGNNT